MTEDKKQLAINAVWRNWRVRLTCRRTPAAEDRCGRIAVVLCGVMDAEKPTLTLDKISDRQKFYSLGEAKLSCQTDYDDLVSFIPLWLVGIILKIIIAIIIDFWFQHEALSNG